jgi:HEAT repeat protein
MFAFYTTTSVGILWLEVSVAALFLGEYGAESLPWIYIASAGIGAGSGFIYSWMQKVLPLRRVLVLTAVLMALPLLLFWLGLTNPLLLGGYTVFLMRLWLEAIYIINELNTSIAANQLFTIREIKRTYPLISSGILAADVLSGFSLPVIRGWIGLPNVILVSCLMLLIGAGILLGLTRAYRSFFPDPSRRRSHQDKQPDFTAQRLQGSLQRYVGLIVAFFVMVQVLAVLLDFQYLSQLEQNVSVETIADFLALFSATLGIFELGMQWFVSGRVIERLGVFVIALLPPVLIMGLGSMALIGLVPLFLGTVILKFVDELLRYTLVASTGPVLFQPIPDTNRSRIQSSVHGIAEPLAAGLTGVGMLATIWVVQWLSTNQSDAFQSTQNLAFLFYTILFAALWLVTVLFLRSNYLRVLVLSADRGQLSLSSADLQLFKRNVVEVLNRPTTALAEKKSCIELLSAIDPRGVGEIVAPLLSNLPAVLQRQSLEAMLQHPNPAYLDEVRSLMQQPLLPEVLAAALRFVWLSEPDPDIGQLRAYLTPDVDPVVRGTAAALMMRRGDLRQKAEAIETLRRMLTHKQEWERVVGCRALGETLYLQSLRLYIQPLLQDESLRVRRAMLEVIAATHLDDYYPSLLRGLQYTSTREAAKRALVRLENESLPLLLELAEDVHKPEALRVQAWSTIGLIDTPEALDLLVSRLVTAWGWRRRILLRVLLKQPYERGIEAVGNRIGRSGIESFISQELQLLAHIYAGLVDLGLERVSYEEANLLWRALRDAETDAIERLFLLMRFLYDSNQIQAAAFNLQSGSRESVAQGLEILDNTLDLSMKQALLNSLERQLDLEKLQSLSGFHPYQPLRPSQRLRQLVELRHFLSDWALACCFHVARRARWSLTAEQTLACLRHPSGFVREAVLAYLQIASPKTLRALLPLLHQDPDRLVAAQVQQMMAELGFSPLAKPLPHLKHLKNPSRFTKSPGLEPI